MCGRYYIEISDAALKEIADEILRIMTDHEEYKQLQIKFEGEIFPTNVVPVKTASDRIEVMRWGFSGFNQGGKRSAQPIINARSETVLEKPTFRKAVLEQRCLVPASGYYEWKKHLGSSLKDKYQIHHDAPVYLAGCYRLERAIDDQVNLPRFVILTKPAAESIAGIHDRMPVVFDGQHASQWLLEGMSAADYALSDLQFELAS